MRRMEPGFLLQAAAGSKLLMKVVLSRHAPTVLQSPRLPVVRGGAATLNTAAVAITCMSQDFYVLFREGRYVFLGRMTRECTYGGCTRDSTW